MKLFIVLFFAELFLSIKVGIEIGFFWSSVWVLTTIFMGFALLKLSPYTIGVGVENFVIGRFNLKMLHTISISYLLGAILLIVPGVFSDIVALILLLYVLYLHLFVTIPTKSYDRDNSNYEKDSYVIDTEIIDGCDSNDKLDKRGGI
jgi:2-isopropylmalate synthase/UPF0716 protein FxsA